LATARTASVVPLEYEIHPEHSAFLVDYEWDRLVDFLADPRTYLSQAEAGWRQSAENHVSWTLRTPCLARIEPLAGSELPVELLLQAAGEAIVAGEATGLEQLHALWSNRESRLSKGLFVLEYTPGTAMLSVTYLPPFVPRETPRYSKGYTTPTIVRLGASNYATVHVDLAAFVGQAAFSSRDRAEYMVDLLEDRNLYAQSLNEHVRTRTDGAYLVTYELKPEGDAFETKSSHPRQAVTFVAAEMPRSDPAYLTQLTRLTVEDPGLAFPDPGNVIEGFSKGEEAIGWLEPITVRLLPKITNKAYITVPITDACNAGSARLEVSV